MGNDRHHGLLSMTDPRDTELIECTVTYTALARGDRWEGSCACGWWHKGTKKECERAANGHRIPEQRLSLQP